MDDVDTESATEAAAKTSAILLITHLSEASTDARVEKALSGFSTPSRELKRSCDVTSPREGRTISTWRTSCYLSGQWEA
jgi:hypothetical protein